jgi:hypothetical protein
MRLPGFDWTKAGYARFSVQIISSSEARYGVEELLAALPPLPPTAETAFGHHNKCSGITTTALIVVSKRQQATSFPSMSHVIEYLKQQDLGRYLGLGPDLRGTARKVNCPFHTDTKASATLARDAVSGRWLFCCHSSNCGVKGSIIDLTMRNLNTSDPGAALRHLMQQFNLRVETGWKAREEAILNRNIAILDAHDAFLAQYPSLMRWIGKVAQDLNLRLRWAKELLLSERFQVGGRAVFFLSLREMERRTRKWDQQPRQFGRHSQRIDRYCLLGLMRKIPDCQIPAKILREAHKHQGHRAHRIQFYSFPEFTPAVLKQADERACKLIEAGASVRGVSRQLVVDLFGEALAQQVYPQRSRQTPDANKAFSERVETVVLSQIGADGYSTSGRIRSGVEAGLFGKTLTHRRIERVLPGILARNGLKKVTATKAMKERLSIGGAGYPKVIVPRSK